MKERIVRKLVCVREVHDADRQNTIKDIHYLPGFNFKKEMVKN